MPDSVRIASAANPRGPEPGRLPASPAPFPTRPPTRPPVRGTEPGHRSRPDAEWPLTLSLLLLLTVACGALGPLLRGSGWWWMMAFAAGGVLLSAALSRRGGLARPFVPLAALGVLLAGLTLFFGGGSGLLWLVPTPQTMGVFQGLVASGAESIAQQSVPAEVTLGMLFLLTAGAGLMAVLMYLVAVTWRAPALAGIPALVPLLVPGVIQAGPANLTVLVLTSIAYLVLLRVEVRRRRRVEEIAAMGRTTARIFVSPTRRESVPAWGTAVVGAVVIVSAVVISVVTPTGTGEDREGPNALLFGSGVSPMINLGQDLRRPEPGPVLHYTSTSEEQSYFTLLTLDSFVGETWTARIDGVDRSNSVGSIASPPGLAPDVSTTQARTSVVIDAVNTRWLPVPARTVAVEGLTGSWHWDTRTRAIAGTDASTLRQEYTATSLDVQPTAAQMRSSSRDYSRDLAANLELPARTPAIIEDTAVEVTAGAASAYDAAVLLQDYLNGSQFAYDTESPVEQDYDGGGADVVGVFLEKKRGYCVHFASAMATMARSLGIPSRISLGYLPGLQSQDLEQGRGQYLVDSHDLHAWPELYFVGVGWVPFEPTPGRGSVPDYEARAAAEAPTGVPGEVAPTTAPRAGPDPLAGDTPLPGVAPVTAQTASVAGRVGLLLLGFLLVLLVPAVAREIQRAGRRRRLNSGALTPRAATLAAWTEVRDCARDHNLEVVDTDTPRECAARLARVLHDDAPALGALDNLLQDVERALYARDPGTVSALDRVSEADAGVRRVSAMIRASSSRRDRVRAILWPGSLLRSAWQRLNGGYLRNA